MTVCVCLSFCVCAFRAWRFIMQTFRKSGSLLVTVPSLQESLDALQVKFVREMNSGMWSSSSVTAIRLCPAGGAAARLGEGTSCGLWRLLGQRHRPRGPQTDPPVPGHVNWSGLISISMNWFALFWTGTWTSRDRFGSDLNLSGTDLDSAVRFWFELVWVDPDWYVPVWNNLMWSSFDWSDSWSGLTWWASLEYPYWTVHGLVWFMHLSDSWSGLSWTGLEFPALAWPHLDWSSTSQYWFWSSFQTGLIPGGLNWSGPGFYRLRIRILVAVLSWKLFSQVCPILEIKTNSPFFCLFLLLQF